MAVYGLRKAVTEEEFERAAQLPPHWQMILIYARRRMGTAEIQWRLRYRGVYLTLSGIKDIIYKLRKRGFSIPPRSPYPFRGRTPPEPKRVKEAVQLVQQGYSCKQIARKMGITLSTVYCYLTRARRRGWTVPSPSPSPPEERPASLSPLQLDFYRLRAHGFTIRDACELLEIPLEQGKAWMGWLHKVIAEGKPIRYQGQIIRPVLTGLRHIIQADGKCEPGN